jgi:phosphatidylglycerol---prolipoprotein diacylglyceryl transferase
MLIHTIFDLLAWCAAALLGREIRRRHWLPADRDLTLSRHPGYFIALSLGALAGAVALGSANLALAGRAPLGHSIAGAILGGIVAVESYKLATGRRGSTGLRFVGPLALGIAVGRIGCFLAGLEDYTYGTPTTLPWAVDFGDGIPRHPVQLYESLAMLGFLALFLWRLARHDRRFLDHGFYFFVGWYALQRYFWEFLKPYPTLLGPLNLFHCLCLALIVYALIMLRQQRHDLHPAR